MRRRALLTAAGTALASFSGCLLTDSGQESRGTEPATETDTETAAGSPTPTYDVTVDSVIQQHGYVMVHDDSMSVVQPARQLVRADVSGVDGDLEREAFTLTVGSDEHAPTQVDSFYPTFSGEYEWYEAGRDGGVLLFDVHPPDDPASVTLSWPGGEWTAGDDLAARIARSGQRMTASLDVPTEWDGEAAPTVRVDVTNEGEETERFLGALNRSGPFYAYTIVDRVSALVDPGETRTLTVDDGWGDPGEGDRGDGEVDVTYRLNWADGDDQAEIRLV